MIKTLITFISVVTMSLCQTFSYAAAQPTDYVHTIFKCKNEKGARMAKLKASLDQHVVVCGVGHTGLATIKELLAKGEEPSEEISWGKSEGEEIW